MRHSLKKYKLNNLESEDFHNFSEKVEEFEDHVKEMLGGSKVSEPISENSDLSGSITS